MRFILIGNYPADKQESMRKYAVSLRDSLNKENLEAAIWYPAVFFGYGSKSTNTGFGKWLGYIDKWIVFPVIIWFRLLFKQDQKDIIYHVCDHSNSPYLKVLPDGRSGITCHDVLAIRGALGYKDAFCPASSTGKILQNWILNNLKKANKLIAVSQLTMNQLTELCEGDKPLKSGWKVIHNSFNAEFYPLGATESWNTLATAGLPKNLPFILHVGSALPRKNRKMLLNMVQELGNKWKGSICFAGQPLDENLIKHARKLGLENRTISLVKPDHQTLLALYSSCQAFVFPSFSEGFGWPLIEAQACGAPVLASSVEPMPEVSNDTALHADPNSARDFANAFMKLSEPGMRKKLIEEGYKNSRRFDSGTLTKEFIKMYAQEVLI